MKQHVQSGSPSSPRFHTCGLPSTTLSTTGEMGWNRLAARARGRRHSTRRQNSLRGGHLDALTSKRAYRDPMAPVAALEHLKVNVGKQFDPGVYDALVRVVSRNLQTVPPTTD